MNERMELLIQLELDGEISQAERDELDAASEADSPTRAYRSQMAELAQDLDTLAWREPSPNLQRKVLDQLQIGTPRPRARAPRPRWRIDFRQAVAFAAGIAAVLVAGRFIPAIDGMAVDPNEAAGTLIAPDKAPEIDRGRVEFGGTSIEAWTERSGDQLYLRARGTGDATTPVRIEWSDLDWSVVSVHSVPPADLGVDRGRASFAWTASGPFTLELELQAGTPGADGGDVRLLIGGGDTAGSSITLDVVP
jgi:hypothetical protein